MCVLCFFFVKQKTAYEMRISDWSSDVCSSDLRFEVAQIFVSAPILGEFDRGAHQMALMAFELGLQPFEKREGVGGGAGEPRDHLAVAELADLAGDRKSVVAGKSVAVRVDLGGRRIIKKKIH